MLEEVVDVDLQRHRRRGHNPIKSAQKEKAQLSRGGDRTSRNAAQGKNHPRHDAPDRNAAPKAIGSDGEPKDPHRAVPVKTLGHQLLVRHALERLNEVDEGRGGSEPSSGSVLKQGSLNPRSHVSTRASPSIEEAPGVGALPGSDDRRAKAKPQPDEGGENTNRPPTASLLGQKRDEHSGDLRRPRAENLADGEENQQLQQKDARKAKKDPRVEHIHAKGGGGGERADRFVELDQEGRRRKDNELGENRRRKVKTNPPLPAPGDSFVISFLLRGGRH